MILLSTNAPHRCAVIMTKDRPGREAPLPGVGCSEMVSESAVGGAIPRRPQHAAEQEYARVIAVICQVGDPGSSDWVVADSSPVAGASAPEPGLRAEATRYYQR